MKKPKPERRRWSVDDSQEFEPAAVIDIDEFEAARRCPRVRKMLETALAYGERVNAQRKKTCKQLIYEGPVYVRPISRGIVLGGSSETR